MSSTTSGAVYRRWAWWGLLVATGGIFVVALAPPFLSPEWRAVVMHAFRPVCHQIPVRSPIIGDIQVAICDRCTGIYLGVVLGVLTAGWGHLLWERLGLKDRYVLLGSLIPAGIDWMGPMLGVWGNGPVSRTLTGLIFGLVAGSFLAHRLLWSRRSDS